MYGRGLATITPSEPTLRKITPRPCLQNLRQVKTTMLHTFVCMLDWWATQESPTSENRCKWALEDVALHRVSILYIKSLVCACVRLWPLDAEKSDEKKKGDGGRIEKWREKDKTTVGWRGPETQVLRAKYRGPETQCPVIEVLKPRSWEPNAEVLKPKCWEPTAATRACRHGRIVSDCHGYPLVKKNGAS
jgi:hypothetical protein